VAALASLRSADPLSLLSPHLVGCQERSRARGERRATEQVHEPGPGEVIEISPWQVGGVEAGV
jgi:hypothetical protein